MDTKIRCFGNKSGQELYAHHHDNEWGIRVHDDRLLHFENFSGLLHKPILAMIRKSTQIGFDSMNLAFKNLCEAKSIQ